MKRLKRTSCHTYVWALLTIIFFSSCWHTKNIAYFRDLSDTTKVYSQIIKETYETKIQPDDIVQILVNSINPEATAVFNLGNTTPASINGTRSTQAATSVNISPNVMAAPTGNYGGYLVDKEGNIDFPVLGQLLVKDMTVKQVKDLLKEKLNKYLSEPIVNVRLLNNKITVLGEVARPATYSIPSERITIIDAIGMAGDLTIYGKRENVLLIREEGSERKFIRLNLNSSSLFQSPYYYLKQNDAIYVEPNKNKVAASDITSIRRISIVTTSISLIVLIISRLIR